ncbi:hypothetical protein Bbelb_049660 [Branchiostoma belcheri]|nr:hypothetical protein Bbelb_049660 [Branchiostoma belcheri]
MLYPEDLRHPQTDVPGEHALLVTIPSGLTCTQTSTNKRKIQALEQKGHNIQIEWCPGHMGVAENEIADIGSKQAVEEAKIFRSSTVWTRQQALKHIENMRKIDRWRGRD